jgi:hypothetical protein
MTTSLDRTASLRLPPPGRDWRQTFWVVAGILMFGAMLVAMALYTAPALLSDWIIRDTARPINGAQVTDGRCSAKLVFHICAATLALRTPSGIVSRRVNYVFTGVHVGSYSVQVLADPARPDLATTDLALGQLWNRTITLLAVAGFLLACTLLPLVALFRNRKRIRVRYDEKSSTSNYANSLAFTSGVLDVNWRPFANVADSKKRAATITQLLEKNL